MQLPGVLISNVLIVLFRVHQEKEEDFKDSNTDLHSVFRVSDAQTH